MQALGVRKHGLAHQVGQIQGLEIEVLAAPGLDASQVEQLVDQGAAQLRLVQDDFQHLAAGRLIIALALQQQFGIAVDAGHGRAQFVCRRAEKFALDVLDLRAFGDIVKIEDYRHGLALVTSCPGFEDQPRRIELDQAAVGDGRHRRSKLVLQPEGELLPGTRLAAWAEQPAQTLGIQADQVIHLSAKEPDASRAGVFHPAGSVESQEAVRAQVENGVQFTVTFLQAALPQLERDFQASALGHIADGQHHAPGRHTLLGQPRNPGVEPARIAQQRRRVIQCLRPSARPHGVNGRHEGRGELRTEDLGGRPAQEDLARQEQVALIMGPAMTEAVVFIHFENDVVNRAHDGGQFALATGQRGLGFLVVGDIDAGADITLKTSIRTQVGTAYVDHPAIDTVVAPQTVFHAERLASGLMAVNHGQAMDPVVRVQTLGPAQAALLLGRAAGEVQPDLVDPGAEVVPVGQPDQYRRLIRQGRPA